MIFVGPYIKCPEGTTAEKILPPQCGLWSADPDLRRTLNRCVGGLRGMKGQRARMRA